MIKSHLLYQLSYRGIASGRDSTIGTNSHQATRKRRPLQANLMPGAASRESRHRAGSCLTTDQTSIPLTDKLNEGLLA